MISGIVVKPHPGHKSLHLHRCSPAIGDSKLLIVPTSLYIYISLIVDMKNSLFEYKSGQTVAITDVHVPAV